MAGWKLFSMFQTVRFNVNGINFEIDLSTTASHFRDQNVLYFGPKLPAKVYMQHNNACICLYRLILLSLVRLQV